MKILIIRTSAIGDVIHTLPAIFHIKHCMPNAEINWVVQEKAKAILEHQPFITNLHILPNKFLQARNLNKTIKTIKTLKQTEWDAIIDFQGLLKTSALIWPLKGKKFGFDKKHTREKVSRFFTHYHTSPVYKNIIQKNLSLASHAVSHLNPSLKTSPATEKLKENFRIYVPEEKIIPLGVTTRGAEPPTVAIAPNTTWPSKHWPLDYWKKLLHILANHEINAILIGAAFGDQAEKLADYIKQHDLDVNIAPKWDLLQIADLLTKINVLVAPDTGLLHLADFLQTKTVGLFGPTLAVRHGPFLTRKNIDAAQQIPCAHRYKKNHGTNDCMTRLLPEELFKIVLRQLSR